jgi:hypothetical protein
LDAFQSIQIQGNNLDEGEDDEADSSQAVADFEEDDSTIADDEDEESALPHHGLLSDREEAERKVMLELVLGPRELKKKNPVDQKVAALVRQSLQKAAAVAPTTVKGATTADTHQDDWHLAYTMMSNDDMQTSSISTGNRDMPPPAPILERSNSLPDRNLMESSGRGGDDAMDTSPT